MNTSDKNKDAEIRGDMVKRILADSVEVSAVAVAMGRWAALPAVADAVRSLLAAAERLGGVAKAVAELPTDYIARPDRMKPAKGWRVDLMGKHAAMFGEAYDVATTGKGTDEDPFRMSGFTVVSVVGGTSDKATSTCKLLLVHASGVTWGPVSVANVALPAALSGPQACEPSTEAMPLSPAQRAAEDAAKARRDALAADAFVTSDGAIVTRNARAE